MLKKIFILVFISVLLAIPAKGQDLPIYYDSAPILDSMTTADGSAISARLDSKGNQIFEIYVPATFDGTTIYIESSTDTTNNHKTYASDTDAVLSISVTAARWYRVKPSDYAYLGRYIWISSDATATGADVWKLTLGKFFKK